MFFFYKYIDGGNTIILKFPLGMQSSRLGTSEALGSDKRLQVQRMQNYM